MLDFETTAQNVAISQPTFAAFPVKLRLVRFCLTEPISVELAANLSVAYSITFVYQEETKVNSKERL